MDNNKKKSGKGGASGIAWAVILLLIYALRRVDFNSLMPRLRWMLNTGRVSEGGVMILAVIAAAVVVLLGIAAVVRVAKSAAERSAAVTPAARRTTASAQHSHDRLAGYTEGSCGDLEHWKKQLDGFLEAGIIDRAEYRVLLERRRSDGSGM